jgi:hypothetical protein
MKLKIFLSAVSQQFKACRDALASDLRAVGAEVVVQEDFQQHGATLLEKLEQYIARCDRVIALVGDVYGFEPGPTAQPHGAARRSYTQWEYFFARGERLNGSAASPKDTFVYFASPEFLALNPAVQSAAEAGIQQAFINQLKASGKDRGTFSGIHELRAQVLRDGFTLAERQAPPNNLPYVSIGSLFKGRSHELAQLRQRLGAGGAAHPTAVVGRAIHGLGGAGKTRLAVEYGWLNQLEYPVGMFFVSADSPESLHQGLAALVASTVLNLPEREAREEEVRVGAALRWLAAHAGWYLVFDNVDSPESARAVEDILPRLGKGHVVITSRLTQWSGAIEPLELDVLSDQAGAEFLLERTEPRSGATGPGRKRSGNDVEDATGLARALGGLALALEQAGAYVAAKRVSLAEYLAAWESSDREVQEWHDARVMKYPRSVASTWETTLSQLDAGQIALLRICAQFAPDPIPLFVFDGEVATSIWRDLAQGTPRGPQSSPSPGSIRDAVVVLANYSLLKWDAERELVSVHRVVQEIIRNRLTAEESEASLRATLALLDEARPREDPADVRTWPRWTLLRTHVARVATAADGAGIVDVTASLYSSLGQLLYALALHRDAEPLMRRALAIDEASYGAEHPSVAIRLNNLAQLLQDTNRLGEAEPLMRRALAIDEASYGAEHPSVAIRLNNLAQLLKATNRLGEAEPLMRRALAIDEASYGAEHPSVAIDLNNLAQLLQDTNRLGEAEPLMRQALAIDEASFGAEHPRVASRLNNLAQLLQATNRLGEAEPLMRRALAIDEASYGAEHPRVAIDLNNLAGLLQDTNRLGEAEPLMRRALAIDEASYGAEHPRVAIRLNNLAQLLQDTNRLGEAEPLMLRHVRIFLRFTQETGHEHPHLRAALGNYGRLLEALGHSGQVIRERLRRLAAEYGVEF